MTRWFVGIKPDGVREVFAETTGTDPIAEQRGYADVCGPYRSQDEAARTARRKPSPNGGTLRNRRGR